MGRVTKYIFLLCALLYATISFAQVQVQRKFAPNDTIRYELSRMLDKPLAFQGGAVQKFTQWCQSKIEYPEEAARHGITGKVTLQFVIDTAGAVSSVKVIRSAHPLLDNEAVRVVSGSPDWEPATVYGAKVNVLFTYPVEFNIKKTSNDTSIIHASFSYKRYRDFMSWVADNIKYPEEAAEKGLSGSVSVVFDVNTEGYLQNVRSLTNPAQVADTGFIAEAVRVVSASPRWIPAMKNGLPVKVSYNVLVIFQ